MTEKIILPDIKDLDKIDVYLNNGGYNAAKSAFQKSPDDIIDIVKNQVYEDEAEHLFPPD